MIKIKIVDKLKDLPAVWEDRQISIQSNPSLEYPIAHILNLIRIIPYDEAVEHTHKRKQGSWC
jgi:hypothetical protein